jgi:two-component system phosphate regulon response regulator OmpR
MQAMTGELPHILVVDDDTRLRELLRKYLSENDFWVTTAANALEARARLASLAFDLIILDLMMPGESGLGLASSLRRESTVPIIMLTAMGDADDRIAGLEHGADDYLAKPFEPRELVLRIRTVLRRVPAPPDPPGTVTLGEYEFDLERQELTRGAERVRLTSSEARLLEQLALNPGLAMSRESLARGGGIKGGDRAVDVQVTRLRRKFEPDPKMPRYLQTVRGKGYLLRPD